LTQIRLLFVAQSAVFDTMQRQSRIATLVVRARGVIGAYRVVPAPTHADRRGALPALQFRYTLPIDVAR
jgi:hypothetical protein